MVISILVRLTLGSRLYLGKHGREDEKLFTLYKFRDMTDPTNKRENCYLILRDLQNSVGFLGLVVSMNC